MNQSQPLNLRCIFKSDLVGEKKTWWGDDEQTAYQYLPQLKDEIARLLLLFSGFLFSSFLCSLLAAFFVAF